MQAQTKRIHPEGEYYLQGVMETACGFLFKADSSFEFFFSQGALDRSGSGKWTVENDMLVLNSTIALPDPFSLKRKSRKSSASITIEVVDLNPALYSYVLCRAYSNGKQVDGTLSSSGSLELPIQTIDSLELQFLFCPEKKTRLIPGSGEENHFVFQLDPSIMDYPFKDFRLKLSSNQLTGRNPILEGDHFTYIKSRK
ncbi:MAG TPA: hypothetical protein VHK91_00430 [Flavisolibacter sp.]|jgi:hypothetical protein|nr:hypothetical protein [Flavisolibacter sp.]